MVGPVTIPAADDKPEFVIQVASNRVDVDEFNRWAAPLGDSIARAVAGDLVVLLCADVATAPMANFDADYRSQSTSSDSSPPKTRGWCSRRCGPYQNRRRRDALGSNGRTGGRTGRGFDPLAAAHSRALAEMSADIAAAIRAEANQSAVATRDSTPMPMDNSIPEKRAEPKPV